MVRSAGREAAVCQMQRRTVQRTNINPADAREEAERAEHEPQRDVALILQAEAHQQCCHDQMSVASNNALVNSADGAGGADQ